jgi:hypothetical protein
MPAWVLRAKYYFPPLRGQKDESSYKYIVGFQLNLTPNYVFLIALIRLFWASQQSVSPSTNRLEPWSF